ncbi:MAG: sensor domain-containing diguanylate cyclase [Nevskiales bacterium]|nr:sensor domain-containing diguanylate cyclase [Nevskiales bacterium]
MPTRQKIWELDPSVDPEASRHEGLLQRQPEKYADMVHSITAFGIYLIDRRGCIQSWNRGAEIITGLSRAEVIGKPYDMLFPQSAVHAGKPRKTLEFARTNSHCREEQVRRRNNGEEFLALASIDTVRSEAGELQGFVEIVQDITEVKQREDRLYRQATRDEPTGLFNRGHFIEMASLEIERARRFAEPVSLILLDIDHLRRINDTYGHETGDRVISALAKTCLANARKIDVVGRLGGEEFAIALPRANKQPAMEMAQRLRQALSQQRIQIGGGREIAFTVSMGVAALRQTTRDLTEMMRNADAALYKAKRDGRNRVEAWFE